MLVGGSEDGSVSACLLGNWCAISFFDFYFASRFLFGMFLVKGLPRLKDQCWKFFRPQL